VALATVLASVVIAVACLESWRWMSCGSVHNPGMVRLLYIREEGRKRN